MTYIKALEIASNTLTKIANMKDWQVPSKGARSVRELARTLSPEEFIGTICEMVEKFPTLFSKFTNTVSVADHEPEDRFVWVIHMPIGRSVYRASDFTLITMFQILN